MEIECALTAAQAQSRGGRSLARLMLKLSHTALNIGGISGVAIIIYGRVGR